jgi:hypothetical protein
LFFGSGAFLVTIVALDFFDVACSTTLISSTTAGDLTHLAGGLEAFFNGLVSATFS